jgi:hypothetical protein
MVERWEIITEGSDAQGRVGRAHRERRGWPARRSATPGASSLQRYSRPKRRLTKSRRAVGNRWAAHLPRRPRHAPGIVPASAPCSRRGFFASGADLQLIQETLPTRRSTRPRGTRGSRRRVRMVTVARLLGRRRAMIPAAISCGECPSLAVVGPPSRPTTAQRMAPTLLR